MYRKLVAIFFCFIMLAQVIPMASLVKLVAGYFNNNDIVVSFVIFMPDEEIEEDGIKAPVSCFSTMNDQLNHFVKEQINKEVQYLHHIHELPEGFARILYTPPNFS